MYYFHLAIQSFWDDYEEGWGCYCCLDLGLLTVGLPSLQQVAMKAKAKSMHECESGLFGGLSAPLRFHFNP
jgi:hypothetical protein